MNLLLGHAALYQIKVADALLSGSAAQLDAAAGRHVGQMRCRNLNIALDNVTEAEVCSDRAPLTYADYQNKLKPKPEKAEREQKIVGWRCKICGYVYEGSALPEDYACPLCGHGTDDFEPVYEE